MLYNSNGNKNSRVTDQSITRLRNAKPAEQGRSTIG
jgi:hypothetical protein